MCPQRKLGRLLLTHLLRQNSGNIRCLLTLGSFKRATLRKIILSRICFARVWCHVLQGQDIWWCFVLTLIASASPDPAVFVLTNCLLSPGVSTAQHINLGHPQILCKHHQWLYFILFQHKGERILNWTPRFLYSNQIMFWHEIGIVISMNVLTSILVLRSWWSEAEEEDVTRRGNHYLIISTAAQLKPRLQLLPSLAQSHSLNTRRKL